MTDLALFVQMQYRVAAFLAGQPEDRLRALIEGKVSLAIVDLPQAQSATGVGAPQAAHVISEEPVFGADAASRSPSTVKPKVVRNTATVRHSVDPPPAPEEVAKRLCECESVDEATQLLAQFKLGAPAQKDVARALGITPRGTKPEVARQIVNQAVGARLKFAGLRQR